MKIHRNPTTTTAPIGGYSHGLEVGGPHRTLYISGQIPELPNGDVPADFEAQCHAVWGNIHEILKTSGMGFEHLVKVTTYLTSRDQVETNSRVRRAILGDARPALTVMIAQTLQPEWFLEIDAVAVADIASAPEIA